MKVLGYLIILFVIGFNNVYSQTPESFKYQAVIRNLNGITLTTQGVSIRISIVPADPAGEAVYIESHQSITNEFGLVNLNIGKGTIEKGSIAKIDWSRDLYFLRVEIDENGGTSYKVLGTSQLLSVPFALHAKTAEQFKEADPVWSSVSQDYYTKTDAASASQNYYTKIEAASASQNYYTKIEAASASGNYYTKGEAATASENYYTKIEAATASENYYTKIEAATASANYYTKAEATSLENQLLQLTSYIKTLEERILALETNVPTYGDITDFDGNNYSFIKIGTQFWMNKNLNALHYADGTPIPEVLTYNNDEALAAVYGRLYRWPSAMRGSVTSKAQGACPNGTHVPSEEEWTTLIDYLGGPDEAGGKLKHAGTTYWQSPNTGATNTTGFAVLPSGGLELTNAFLLIYKSSLLWTSTDVGPYEAGCVEFSFDNSIAQVRPGGKNGGGPIRCIKD